MTHLALNGNAVLLTLTLLALTIIGSIIGLRYYWKNKLKTSTSRANDSPLKNTGSLHAFGICIALVSAIALMSWTQTERSIQNYVVDGTIDVIEIEIPTSTHVERKSKPLPPPPPENRIIEKVEDLVEVKEPEKIPIEVPVDVEVVESEDAMLSIPPPILDSSSTNDIIDEYVKDDKEHIRVEHMPRFPGCNSEELTKEEKTLCSEKELMKYISQNLKYPALARGNGIEGRVFVEFVVDQKGNLTKIKVVRDIGAGCGAAAEKVISNMIKEKGLWTPGMQRGRNVKVKYTMPITFKLAK